MLVIISYYSIDFVLARGYNFIMTPKDKVILIVEDEAPILSALEDNLGAEGFQVLKASDGVDGLLMAIEKHPDLILLDIMMPRMDGLKMLEKLRADEWGKKVPVIILTNYGDNDKIAEAITDDVSEYFIKSDIKMEEVVERIKAKLEV